MKSSPKNKGKHEINSLTNRTQYQTSRTPKTIDHNIYSHNHQKNETAELQCKLAIQNNILKEYESWVYTLLTVINEKDRNDTHINIGSMIQKGLERIEKLKNDNYDLKYKIALQQETNQQALQRKKEMQSEIANIKDDMKNEYITIVNNDNKRLSNNIQFLADELDTISELKNKLEEKTNEIKLNVNEYNEALKEYNKMQREWNIMQKIIRFKKELICTMQHKDKLYNYNNSNNSNSNKLSMGLYNSATKRDFENNNDELFTFDFEEENEIK